MELTGPRRFILLTLFASVAWAGFLILFFWNGIGLVATSYEDSYYFAAGNPFSVVLALAAVVIAGRAMQRPTLERASWACSSLAVLTLGALGHVGAEFVATELQHADRVHHFPVGVAVRTAVWFIPAAGFIIHGAVALLARWEGRARASVLRSCAA